MLAEEVSEALREFIVTGYETETPSFAGEFRRLVEEQQDGEAFLKSLSSINQKLWEPLK